MSTNGFAMPGRTLAEESVGAERPAAGRWSAVGTAVTEKSSQNIQGDTEDHSRFYPSDFDYYRDVVANNAPRWLVPRFSGRMR